MAQLDPIPRGYRLALRDVQRAVILNGQTIYADSHSRYAVFVAAAHVSMALKEFKEAASASKRSEVGDLNLTSLDGQKLFASGYASGFDQAVATIADWHGRMRDPVARQTISDILQSLERHRPSADAIETGSVITLRKRKFAL